MDQNYEPPSPPNDRHNDIKLRHIKHPIRRIFNEITANKPEMHFSNAAIVIMRDHAEVLLVDHFNSRRFSGLNADNYEGPDNINQPNEAEEIPNEGEADNANNSESEEESNDSADDELLTTTDEGSQNDIHEISDESLPETEICDSGDGDDDGSGDGSGVGQDDGSDDGEPPAKNFAKSPAKSSANAEEPAQKPATDQNSDSDSEELKDEDIW
jgi:hypothetical protein